MMPAVNWFMFSGRFVNGEPRIGIYASELKSFYTIELLTLPAVKHLKPDTELFLDYGTEFFVKE